MKVCIIGTEGHISYALEGIRNDENLKLLGVASGPEGVNVSVFNGIMSEIKPAPVFFNNYNEMFDCIKPDIAVVACQFWNHAAVSIEALKRNIHVFTEKPVATEFGQLDSLCDAYEKSDANLGAMFGIRNTPHFQSAKKAVERGEIGRILMMNAQKSYKLGQRADFFKERRTFGGIIPWVGSHAIDWLAWFSGESFRTVYATHSRAFNKGHGELETYALCHFTMSNDISASVSIDYMRPQNAPSHDDDRIRIVGSKGILEVREKKVYLINKNHKAEELPLEDCGLIFNDFVSHISSGKRDESLAQNAFNVTRACLNARLSADERRVIEF